MSVPEITSTDKKSTISSEAVDTKTKFKITDFKDLVFKNGADEKNIALLKKLLGDDVIIKFGSIGEVNSEHMRLASKSKGVIADYVSIVESNYFCISYGNTVNENLHGNFLIIQSDNNKIKKEIQVFVNSRVKKVIDITNITDETANIWLNSDLENNDSYPTEKTYKYQMKEQN